MIEFIRRFSDNLKLNGRFNILISTLLIFIFSLLGFSLYMVQKEDIFGNSDKQLRVLLEDLVNIFEVQTSQKKKNIESTMKFALSFFYEKSGITQSDSSYVDIEVEDERFGKRMVKVKKWTFANSQLQYNYDFVDFIKGGGVDYATIFQKTPEGFLRVSTNLLAEDSTRAVGTFLPPNSPIIESVAESKRFVGRVNIMGKWYLTSYEPIFVNGEVNGILGIGVEQIDYETIKPIFRNKTYFKEGYPFVVSGDGISIINPDPKIEGNDQKGTTFYSLMISTHQSNQERFKYRWPEKGPDFKWKYAYLKYYKPLDIYIATSLYEEDLYTGIDRLIKMIAIGMLISIVVFFICISFIIRPMTLSIKKLSGIIYTMSQGRLVEKIYYRRRDEIGDIINSLNHLIRGIGDTAKFSNEIEKGNFDSHFSPMSKDDILGNALLDMRKSLQKAHDEEENRKSDDEKRNWTSEGLSMFNDILRKSSEDIAALAAEVMHRLVKYMRANQGGLFIYNDDKHTEPFFELISAYAYDRQKHRESRVSPGEGLVGTCAVERETIYITEIPENYIEVESGLGSSNPRALLLVPMKLDDKIFGVIELASFKAFQPYEISFVERLGENIASTLSTAKMNVRTKQLLKESREQSEELAVKEEQMRQNLIELQTTQEESAKRQAEMSGVVSALDSSFLVSELDLSGRILRINRAYLELFDISVDDALGKYQSDLIQLEDMQREVYDDFWSHIKQNKDGVKIQSKRMAGGVEYWLSETLTPICDNNGEPYKVLNIAIDITQNKKQEFEIQQLLADSRRKAKKLAKQEKLNSYNVEKLAKTQAESARKEAELKSVLDAIDNTSLRGEYDIEGLILHVNENYLKIMGYNSSEMVGKNNKMFIPAEEVMSFEQAWGMVMQGKVYHGVVQRRTKSGINVWLLISYTPLIDKSGAITKILFLAHDVSGLKIEERDAKGRLKEVESAQKEMLTQVNRLQRLNTELLESKHRALAIMDIISATCAVVEIDADGIIIDCNDLAAKRLHKTRKEIPNKSYLNLLASQAEMDEFSINWVKLSQGETIQKNYETVVEGRHVMVADIFVPITNEEGRVYRVINIYSDSGFLL